MIKKIIQYLFTKQFFMFYLLLSFFVLLWQKTRLLRSTFTFSECRFYPSCSDYFLEAVKKHGLSTGLILSTKRLLKCHPLCEGGIDLVPEEN